jgi:hypothetical protein
MDRSHLADTTISTGGDELRFVYSVAPVSQGDGDMFDSIFYYVAQINAHSSEPAVPGFLVQDQHNAGPGNATAL